MVVFWGWCGASGGSCLVWGLVGGDDEVAAETVETDLFPFQRVTRTTAFCCVAEESLGRSRW